MGGARLREWRSHWPLVLSCLAGSTIASKQISTTGVLMKPLHEAFGWTRGQVSATVTFSSIATVLFSIGVGALTRRVGPRRVALVASPLSAAAFAAIGFTGPSLWTYYAVFAIFAAVQVASGPIIWATAVTSKFKASRGAALGVGLSGIGVASLIYPSAAVWLLEHSGYGWRGVFVGLAAADMLLLLPLLIVAFHPSTPREAITVVAVSNLGGASLGEAVRTGVYWRVTLVLIVAALTVSTMMIHLLPLLTDKGVSVVTAASVVAVAGGSTVVGRCLGGFLLDHIHARWITPAFFLLPALGCVLLSRFSGNYLQAVIAAALIGGSAGVEGDMLPFLLGRYFGRRDYPRIYGLTMVLYSLGYALAPVAAGFLFDATGSYKGFLVTLSGLLVLAAAVSASFGPYPPEGVAESCSESDEFEARPPEHGELLLGRS